MMSGDQADGGMELIDLLIRNTEGASGYHGNQPWTITMQDTMSPAECGADDFLDALLAESDSSSVAASSASASPLWSPCVADSPESLALPPPPPLPPSCTTIDVGWEPYERRGQLEIAYYLTTGQSAALSTSQTLTVKDLLLSNLGRNAQQISQHPLQAVELNEDEKKLLAKEGVNLPSKLPLSKFEERVLKKIRRKIRNKRSAQESRKKKRNYVDSLEERMSACNAHNMELQRRIQQLEHSNNVLSQQLGQLLNLLPIGSVKTAQTGTCILVLLLSFSLIISSNLQPEAYSRAEYAEVKAPSRSLLSIRERAPPPTTPPPPPSSPPLPPAAPIHRGPNRDALGQQRRMPSKLETPTFSLASVQSSSLVVPPRRGRWKGVARRGWREGAGAV